VNNKIAIINLKPNDHQSKRAIGKHQAENENNKLRPWD